MPLFAHERRCAESIARLAGHHILRQRREHLDISLKAPDDLVTNVDRSTEKLIVAHLRQSFPDDHVAGEEFGAHGDGPESKDIADIAAGRVWIIDPIDGTLNFAQGIPLFCVSIALHVDGEPQVAVVYDPNRDELFSAAAKDGAHLNGQKLKVSAVTELGPAVLVTGFPLGNTPAFEKTMAQFDALTRQSRGIRRLGSAAIDLAYVAAGRMEAFWEYGLKPWDTAAGMLLVTEAGGTVTTVDGSPYRADRPSVVASNGHIHKSLVESLQNALKNGLGDRD